MFPQTIKVSSQLSQATDSISPVSSDEKTIQKFVEVGYTKAVSQSHQEEILHSIAVHHCPLNIKAELDQLRDGLRTLGLLQSLEWYPSLFETLFIAKNTSSMTAGNDLLFSSTSLFVCFFVYCCMCSTSSQDSKSFPERHHQKVS